jgi:hypothetical protein
MQLHYLVTEVAGQIVSSCTLAIIPHLTRSTQKPVGVAPVAPLLVLLLPKALDV